MPSLRRSLLRRYRLFAPYLSRHGWILLALLLLGDGIATLCYPQLQAALSLHARPAHLALAATPTSLLAGENVPPRAVLATDTFQRPDQRYWGMASDGKPWQDDASSEHNFMIASHMGVIEATPQPIYCNALLGPPETNMELTFEAELTQYNGSVLGAVLHWSDANNFYALSLDGKQLTLTRVMDGMQIPLQSVAFPARQGALYTFRFRAQGAQLFALVWPTDQPAPATWQIVASDSALPGGRAGLRALILSGAQARITAYKEVQL